MKKILLIAMLLTLVNADSCDDDIREATRFIVKADNVKSKEQYVAYINAAISNLVSAKYDCPKGHKEAIQQSIEDTKELL